MHKLFHSRHHSHIGICPPKVGRTRKRNMQSRKRSRERSPLVAESGPDGSSGAVRGQKKLPKAVVLDVNRVAARLPQPRTKRRRRQLRTRKSTQKQLESIQRSWSRAATGCMSKIIYRKVLSHADLPHSTLLALLSAASRADPYAANSDQDLKKRYRRPGERSSRSPGASCRSPTATSRLRRRLRSSTRSPMSF